MILPRVARRVSVFAFGLALLPMLAGCPGGVEMPAPTITAQGFDIGESQVGPLHGFQDLKVRIEAPAGIDALRLRERSYDVDLAKSPETAHFGLFGLSRRVWSKKDVTLNVRSYLNEKLERPGPYTLELTVRDRHEQTATATLVVVVAEPPQSDTELPPVEAAPEAGVSSGAVPSQSGAFRLERVGPGPVSGSEDIGLTWKTVESVNVVIRLRGAAGEASRLARLSPDEFGAIVTRGDMARVLAALEGVDTLELAMANDAAAGQVFAVLNDEGSYVLRADHSETSLSDHGTTVTLTGRYKR